MEKVLLALIGQLNASVFTLILILLAVGFALWKLSTFLAKYTQEKKFHDDRLCKVENMHDTVIEIKTKLELVYNNTNPNRLAKNNSPISLTEKGKALSEEIKAKEIFEKIRDRMERAVEEEKPQNAYDIQSACNKVAKNNFLNLLKAEDLILLKETAFRHGIPVEDFYIIFGLFLRDYLLEKKGIPIHEVDRFDPQQK
jgi:hypothetical protein